MTKELTNHVATNITDKQLADLTKLATKLRRPIAWVIREAIAELLKRELKS